MMNRVVNRVVRPRFIFYLIIYSISRRKIPIFQCFGRTLELNRDEPLGWPPGSTAVQLFETSIAVSYYFKNIISEFRTQNRKFPELTTFKANF